MSSRITNEEFERDDPGGLKRADARRNYGRLVAAARKVFAAEGGGASMEAIAREAGVGSGTLYRHFPRRTDVVEAVYRDDVDELVRTAERTVANLEPWSAVTAFFVEFVRFAKRKKRFLNELREAFDSSPDLKFGSLRRLEQAMSLVINRAQRAGVMRTDVDGAELVLLMAPSFASTTLSEDQTTRLLGVILDGLRMPDDQPRGTRGGDGR